jgi:hypothetical protein
VDLGEVLGCFGREEGRKVSARKGGAEGGRERFVVSSLDS